MQLGFFFINAVLIGLISALLLRARHHVERERDRAAQLLAERSRTLHLFDAISSGSTDAIFVRDLKGHFLLLNQAAAAYLDKTPDELMGQHSQSLLHAQDHATLDALQAQILAQGHAVQQEHWATLPGGRRLFSLVCGPLRDEQAAIVGIFGIARDITAQREIVQAMHARNEELERINRAMVGRELDMIALKREVNTLSEALQRPPPYSLAFLDQDHGDRT